MWMYSEANEMCLLEKFFVSFTGQEFSQTMCNLLLPTEVLNLTFYMIPKSSIEKVMP